MSNLDYPATLAVSQRGGTTHGKKASVSKDAFVSGFLEMQRLPIRILILSASIGTGHLRAAEAIELALHEQNAVVQVRHEDALRFANTAFRKIYQKSYINLVNKAPHLLGFLYNYADKAWMNETHGIAFERWNSTGLIDLVREYKPDAVVCTHPLPADMISWLTCKGVFSAHHGIVITDYDINPLWLCHHYSRYFVGIEETRQHMAALGYRPELLTVTGIPVNPEFAKHKDKVEMRRKYGLDPQQTTILMTLGGLGMGPMEDALLSLKGLKSRAQIVAVCGDNEELKAAVAQTAQVVERVSGNRVKCIGYTDRMDEYMAASDLVIGKPGGLTSSEALCKGLVFVIVSPVPGQEERNADHLIEEWAAIRCNNLPTLAYKVDSLLTDSRKLNLMRQKALALARPDAAKNVAKEILGMIANSAITAVHPTTHRCRSGELSIA